MARIIVTADLHHDRTGGLTPPAALHELRTRIEAAAPDAVVLAGDLGHPFEELVACLGIFAEMPAPVGVIAGNHDVWADESGISSAELWSTRIPGAVRTAGMCWLEADDIRLGGVAIVGSMAWYDYSAAPPHLGHDAQWYAQQKDRKNADAWRIDWPLGDAEVAERLRTRLRARLARLEEDAAIGQVVVVTHVPLFECQMARDPGNTYWEESNAYFGNLTTGHMVARFPKVVAVVSGHTHHGRRGRIRRDGLPPMRAAVVDSDYGSPGIEVLDLP